jgi:hypothetical protein
MEHGCANSSDFNPVCLGLLRHGADGEREGLGPAVSDGNSHPKSGPEPDAQPVADANESANSPCRPCRSSTTDLSGDRRFHGNRLCIGNYRPSTFSHLPGIPNTGSNKRAHAYATILAQPGTVGHN